MIEFYKNFEERLTINKIDWSRRIGLVRNKTVKYVSKQIQNQFVKDVVKDYKIELRETLEIFFIQCRDDIGACTFILTLSGLYKCV